MSVSMQGTTQDSDRSSALLVAETNDGSRSTDEQLISTESPNAQKASLTLYLSVLVCCVSPLLFGISIAFTSPTQQTMEGDKANTPEYLRVVTKDVESLYASLFNVGAVVGAFSGSFMSERLGRKKTLCLTTVPHVIGWVATSFLSNDILLICFRLLIGWGVGVGSAVTPVYINEISTSELRGALGAANQLSVTIGIFLVNAVGAYGFSVTEGSDTFVQWRSICLLNAGITLLLLPVSMMPESPKWLAGQKRSEDAKRALERLRAEGTSTNEANQLLAEVAKQVSIDTEGSSAGLRSYRKSLVIALAMQLFQQLSGVNAVMMYTSKICAQAGVEDSNSVAMIVMGAQVILTGVSCLLMEKAGRRLLLLFGSGCMTTGSVLLAYYFLAEEFNFWGPSPIALVGLGIFILGFSLGLGPIPWLLVGEIFPTEVRGMASSIATATNWAASFLVTLTFSNLQHAITKEGTFFLFSMICMLCFIFVMAKVPETKGKSVDEVLAILQGGARNIPVEARAPSHV
mmetsp:Transcript_77254/g.121989  ORF Transcript_77254/g.121989 Transcript_77254/m.121989 type:complete len:516 (-) Transcript_77254:97-1644(-)